MVVETTILLSRVNTLSTLRKIYYICHALGTLIRYARTAVDIPSFTQRHSSSRLRTYLISYAGKVQHKFSS